MVGRLFLSSHTFQLKSYKVIDMNGIHDMGGMTCFGQIENDQNEPVFHDDWERKVLAITIATSSCLLYTSPSPRDATLSRMAAWA